MADDTTATVDTTAASTATTDGATAPEQTTPDGQAPATPEVQGAPETYQAFTLPEGVQINDTIMGEFSQLAKGANLPQDKAQALVELGAKMAKGFESAAQQSLTELKTSFATQLANDKQLGGENLDANLAIAQRAIKAFGTPELDAMLTESGLNKHPDLVRFFHAVGQTVTEDAQVDSGASGTASKSLAERMYGATNAA